MPNQSNSDLTVHSIDSEEDSDYWKLVNRRASVNLLDMTDTPSVEPNVIKPLREGNDLLDKDKGKICISKFDPLVVSSTEKSAVVTIEADAKPPPTIPAKVMPTRLPTPKRPVSYSSFEHLQEKPVQLDPTPPSSPGRRVRHTSIARLVKVGKANRELAEFDPLISPMKASKDPSCSKKGAQTIETDSMKQSTATITTPSKSCNPTTRIPLPAQLQYHHKAKEDETPIITRSNHSQKEDQVSSTNTIASKLRKPEVIVPKSIKRLPSNPRKEMVVNYQRRPSYPTGNEIIQDQLDKERENSRRLSANLISAHGLISQPDDIIEDHNIISSGITRTVSHEERMDILHDRLQCLVDVRHSVDTNDEHEEPTEYKKESGNTEVMSAKAALNRYRPFLSPFEKMEIMRYPAIYCVGSHAKKIMASTDQTAMNYGYDDEKGDYQIVIKDHLNYRYEIIESLGKGSFGQVVKCRDHKPQNDESSTMVAVKIIRNKKRFHAQAQTEVKILEQLSKWDPKNKHYNVKMMDSFYFRGHLCIVFECLSLNLYEILQQNSYQGFSMGLVKRFAYQILTSLKLLSEHNIIHCDLKPENILLKQPDRSGIRVIDYGSSCHVNEKVYTYIQSRFYRAPEVILGLEYGLGIDMWSTGCILAELYTGRPLFPGENEPDQLACIMQLLGVPEKDYLERCTRKKQFFDTYDQPRKSVNSKGKKRRPNSMKFNDALKRSTYDNFDRDFGDFISRCVTWEPEKRMNPVEALAHPWVQNMKK